jgi:hypothetical protein
MVSHGQFDHLNSRLFLQDTHHVDRPLFTSEQVCAVSGPIVSDIMPATAQDTGGPGAIRL